MALRAYNSPGVTVSETVNPSLAPLLVNPSVVALIGPASGLQTASERIALSGTTPVNLKFTGVSTVSVVVSLGSTGEVLNPGNYTITAGTDPDATVTGDEPYSITRKIPPATAPTVSPAGTGTLTGIYRYAISFINAGGETGIGPKSIDTTITGAGFNLTNIPLGPAGTTSRNIYREKVVSSVGQGVHLVATISDNTTTTLTNETTIDATALTGAAPKTAIGDGDTVIVTYNYTDNFYYEPTLFTNFSDIADKYGAPFDANGNINSALTFAARLIFINGASELICVATGGTASSYFDTALASLENETEVRLLAVASGDSTVHSSVAAHVNKMNAQGLYRLAAIGRDGTVTAVTAATLRSAAQAFNNEAIVLVSPANFQITNPVTARPLNVGGQYVAAAAIGMMAGRDVQIPLTRKSVAGFDAINDKRTQSELALDSAAGLSVVENKGGVIRIRHSVTTAVGDVNKREASVVRAKYDLAHRVKGVLDSGVVGLVAPITRVPLIVIAAVTGVLEQLVVENAISSYANVSARVLDSDPSTVEVKFGYIPAYPINNIQVTFTIDTQSGDLTLTTT